MNQNIRRPFLRSIMLSLLVSAGGVLSVTTSARANENSDRQEKLNGGYYLFHHLAESESKLPLLVAIKHTPPEIADYVGRISKIAQESTDDLDRMQKGDGAIRFDKNPLPPIEQDVRQSLQDDKQHQLLFGTTDSDFVRALLVSQIEASGYALHLTKVLAEQEKNADRSKTLQHLSAKWLVLRNEAYRFLKN